MRNKKYKAFISYSHKDAKVSKWLHRELESYRVPKHLVGTTTANGKIPAKLFPIFRDRDDLAATTHMSDAILEALTESEFLIVICSPASAQSALVNREIQEFKKLNGDKNILCLIAGGVPFSRNPDQECFSELLRRHISPDGTPKDYAPEGLAADIRPGSDGKPAAISKLVAGMLGVQLNILVRREMQQQKRRFMAALAGSAAVLVLVSALLIQTIRSENLAEKRLHDTSHFLTFLHETVYEALDADGNTAAQAELARAVYNYYQDASFQSADIDFLSNWSGSVLRLGQNLERRGKNEEATELFKQMREFGIRYARNHPSHFRARFREQNAEFFHGYLKLRTGKYDEAEKSFRQRLETALYAMDDPVLTEGFHMDSKKTQWSNVVADSHALLGRVLAGPQDQVAEAENLIKKSIEYRQSAIDGFDTWGDPFMRDSKRLKISLTSAYLYMGNLYRRIGALDSAQTYYQKRVDLLSSLLDETPNDFNLIRRISVAELELAKTLMDKGETEKALALSRKQVASFHQVTEQNPSNVEWFSDLVDAQNQLVDFCIATTNCPDIDREVEEALDLSSDLTMRDNDRPRHRLALYQARFLNALHLWLSGNIATSLSELTSLIDALEAEETSFVRTNGAMETIARIHLLAAIIADQQGDQNTARKEAATVVEVVDARPNPWPEAQAYQALALQYLGEEIRANEVQAALGEIGFDYKTRQSSLVANTAQHHAFAN